MDNRIFLCIDLKSFYASVECIERGLDPMTTNLLVADASRTEKTICLAVSPSLKAYGISGRARLFEAVQQVKKANAERLKKAPGHTFTGTSSNAIELAAHPELELSYITAVPRMAHYMEHSTRIYNIYLKYLAPEDIHVYSIDEVFIDLTHYLSSSGLNAREFAKRMIQDVLETTGITATAGIGTNMYLAKVAMDIVAKHIPADENGVRIAELDEMSYRRQLWNHRPLTDFWRVGRGYAKKLEEVGLFTMGDIARCSVGKSNEYYNEDLLYKLFGINAELLIDHAWGWEPCTIAEVKQYKPENNSVGSGQVLHCPYDFENLSDPVRRKAYKGQITTDRYGRQVPKHAHGTANIGRYTSSTRLVTDAVLELYDRIVDKSLLVRRLNISVNHVICEADVPKENKVEQLDLFTDYAALEKEKEKEDAALEREKKMQQAVLTCNR